MEIAGATESSAEVREALYREVACSGQEREAIGERSESSREDRDAVSMASMLRLVMVVLGGRGEEGVRDRLKERRWWSERGKGELESSEMSQR